MTEKVGHVLVDGIRQERPLVEHRGLLTRRGTMDMYIVHEIERSYGWLDVRGRNVLDVGANIGAFTVWALQHGARTVVALEPDPHNWEMLSMNIDHRRGDWGPGQRAELVEAAVIGPHIGVSEVSLWYPTRGVNMGALSTARFRGRVERKVPAVGFTHLLVEHDITVVKCDCEGAEYDFLAEGVLNSLTKVDQVAAEIHLSKREWRDIQGPRLVASFSRWDAVIEPKIGPKNWTTLGGWRRRPGATPAC